MHPNQRYLDPGKYVTAGFTNKGDIEPAVIIDPSATTPYNLTGSVIGDFRKQNAIKPVVIVDPETGRLVKYN